MSIILFFLIQIEIIKFGEKVGFENILSFLRSGAAHFINPRWRYLSVLIPLFSMGALMLMSISNMHKDGFVKNRSNRLQAIKDLNAMIVVPCLVNVSEKNWKFTLSFAVLSILIVMWSNWKNY